MKTFGVLVLGLLALNVLAGGSTKDDWHEDTDIQRVSFSDKTHERLEDSIWSGRREGDILVGSERTVTDGEAPVWVNTTETKLEMRDGKLVQVTVNRRHKVDKHKHIQKVHRFIHKNYTIADIHPVIVAFGAEFGKPLSELELELFNTLAVTDGNEFEMKYDVELARPDTLKRTLRSISSLFSVKLDEDDIADYSHMIAHSCPDGYLAFNLDTTPVEKHNRECWTLKTDLLLVTCGNEDKRPVKGYQMFAWSASKSGFYRHNMYSPENAATLKSLVTRWLYNNMWFIANSNKPPIDTTPVEGWAERFKHWHEHVDGDIGAKGFRFEGEKTSFDGVTNPDGLDWQDFILARQQNEDL